MSPVQFPQANCTFGPPADMDESQVMTIPAFRGKMLGGNLDGTEFVVVAWSPTPGEIEGIRQGVPIFLCMMGGLAPHYLTVGFPYPPEAVSDE